MAGKPPKESPPTIHSAIPSQGLYSIGDASGNRRWITAGKEVNGWKVGDFDKRTNSLTMHKGDRTERLQMGSGSVGEYTPPLATPDAQMVVGGGIGSDTEESMMNEMLFKRMSGQTMDEYKHSGYIQSTDMDAMKRMLNSFKNNVDTATPKDYQ